MAARCGLRLRSDQSDPGSRGIYQGRVVRIQLVCRVVGDEGILSAMSAAWFGDDVGSRCSSSRAAVTLMVTRQLAIMKVYPTLNRYESDELDNHIRILSIRLLD